MIESTNDLIYTGRMTVSHITGVRTFISGEIEHSKILESPSDTFRVRFVAALLDFCVLSSEDLTASRILGHTCGNIFCVTPRPSILWNEFSRLCESVLDCCVEFSNDPSKHRITIFYEEGQNDYSLIASHQLNFFIGKSISIPLASRQHLAAMFTFICATVCSHSSVQRLGATASTTTTCIRADQLIRMAKSLTAPILFPSLCALSLLEVFSQPFVTSSLSAAQVCDGLLSLLQWQFVEFNRIYSSGGHQVALETTRVHSNTTGEGSPLDVTATGLVLAVKRLLCREEVVWEEPLQRGPVLVHALSGPEGNSLRETAPPPSEGTAPNPDDAFRAELTRRMEGGEWADGMEEWLTTIPVRGNAGDSLSETAPSASTNAQRRILEEILTNVRTTDILVEAIFSHPLPCGYIEYV